VAIPTAKALRCVDLSSGGPGKILFTGDTFNYSDTELGGTNRGVWAGRADAVWSLPSPNSPGNPSSVVTLTNVLYMNGCTFNPSTTNYYSFDVYGETNLCNLSPSCIREDGLFLTQTNESIASGKAINWITGH
jgi:hypothetical protein